MLDSTPHLWFKGCQHALAPQPMQCHVHSLLRLLFAVLDEALLIGHLPMQILLRQLKSLQALRCSTGAAPGRLIHLELALIFHVLLWPLGILHTRKQQLPDLRSNGPKQLSVLIHAGGECHADARCVSRTMPSSLGEDCTKRCGHCTCRPLPTFMRRAPGTRAAAQLRKRSAESAWSASARSCAAARWGLQVQRRDSLLPCNGSACHLEWHDRIFTPMRLYTGDGSMLRAGSCSFSVCSPVDLHALALHVGEQLAERLPIPLVHVPHAVVPTRLWRWCHWNGLLLTRHVCQLLL